MSCSTTQQARFQLRRGDQTYWNTNAGTTPLAGEPCYNITTNQLKIGNGLDTWGNLTYINVAGPVGTYTTLNPSFAINSAVTLAAGSTTFTISPALATSPIAASAVIFNGAVAAPLVANIRYYVLSSASTSSIQVSPTIGGTNIVLATTASNKSGANITITGGDASQFTTSLGVNQALWFTGTPPAPLSTSTLYYLRALPVPYSGSSATIQVSTSFGGAVVG